MCGRNTDCKISEEVTAICTCKPNFLGNPLTVQYGSDCQTRDQICSVCGRNTKCELNEDAEAICKCKPNFKGELLLVKFGGDCTEDRDSSPPSTTEDPCEPNPCGVNAQCRSRNGVAVCLCPSGFKGDPLNSCQEVDGSGQCGLIPESQGAGVSSYIFDGILADQGEYPWVALVEIKREGSEDLFCGGSLITSHHVVTAGHCTEPFELEDISVRLGVLVRSAPVIDKLVFRAEKITVHNRFDGGPIPNSNDIAVVKLDKKVAFTKSIYPICLPKYGESFVGREARVVGWGLVNGSESSGKSSLNELT